MLQIAKTLDIFGKPQKSKRIAFKNAISYDKGVFLFMKTYLNAVNFVKKIINSKEFMMKHRTKQTFFTRSSIKLSFPVLICLILSLSKRLKIKPEAFEELNLKFIDWFYKDNNNLRKFDKFNVFASDGSYFEIPADPKLKSFFEFKSKSDKTNTVRAGANVIFDVCNNKTVCATLHKYTIWERETFVEMFKDFQNLSYVHYTGHHYYAPFRRKRNSHDQYFRRKV